jgi:hypothetical protein
MKERLKVGSTSIWGEDGEAAFLFVTGMAIDADGSPHAYNPTNTGLDYLANAGRPGNWWGIVTDTGKADGKPVLQAGTDPAVGYYVSSTSLADPHYSRIQQRHYVDSESIPFIVLPLEVIKATGIHLGDFGLATHMSSGKQCFVIFADGGPAGKIGEGSIALASALGIPSSPKRGGTSSRSIAYLAFPGSGSRVPASAAEINTKGAAALAAFGGLARQRAWLGAIPLLPGAGQSDVRRRGPVHRPSLREIEGCYRKSA